MAGRSAAVLVDSSHGLLILASATLPCELINIAALLVPAVAKAWRNTVNRGLGDRSLHSSHIASVNACTHSLSTIPASRSVSKIQDAERLDDN